MTRRHAALLLGFLPLLAVLVYSWGSLRGTATPRRPSVLLVTVDTLRPDRLGAYGSSAGLSPGLDALAARGLVFEEALASVPLTLPSHATILTGLEPPRHGVHDNGTYVLPADVETLATRLKAEGYATAAFVGAYVLDRRFGLHRGFDVYDDRIPRNEEGRSVLESERRAEAVVAAASAWLAGQAGPFLAWVHLYDVHAPYDPPPPYRDAHAGRPYDGEVAYADASLARLLSAVREASSRSGGGDPLVAVLADHGESLGEHGELTHGFYIYQSTLRIPFLLAGPGVPVGERRPGPARTADLLPTVLGRLGLAVPKGLDGVDLLAQARAGESYAETLYPRTFGWSALRSFRVGAWKLIEAPRPELYDLARDPGEEHDLAGSQGESLRRLRLALGAFRASERAPASSSVDAETAERLRALGYVTAAPRANEEEGVADPKDRLGAYRAFEEATWAEGRGDRDGALAQLSSLLKADPENPVFGQAFSAALRRAGRSDEAARVLRDLGPGRDDAVAWHERALALAASGEVAEAVRSEQEALVRNPLLPEAHNSLGVLLVRQGQIPSALARFEAATALDPNNAKAWSNRANALRELGRLQEAGTAYRRATDISPEDPDAWNGLGVLAVQGGRAEEGVASFRRALALAPELAEARLNLAFALAQSARVHEALSELGSLLRSRPGPAVEAKARALEKELNRSRPSKELK